MILPADYLAANVCLAYAVTVHKSQGMTVDRAVLVVDRATTAEHLYVGMTRGRHHNQACVVCEPADVEHPTPQRPTAHDGARQRPETIRRGTLRHRNPPTGTRSPR